jgi:hypothetical protein
MSLKWSISTWSPHQIRECISHIYHTCYIPCLSHSGLFVQPNNILWIQILNLLVSESCNRIPNRLLITYKLFWTGYGLDDPGIEFRWGRNFSHTADCTMGTGVLPGVKRPGRGADHPPPSSSEVKQG